MTDANMVTDTVVVVDMKSLPQIACSIRDGHERAKRGGHDWIEGSIEAAANLYAARVRFDSNSEFGKWLRSTGYASYCNGNDRAALIAMGSDPPVMRAAINATTSRSYRVIYQEFRDRFPKPGKTTVRRRERREPTPGKRTKQSKSMSLIIRSQTLGLELYDKIKDTCLGERAELEALIELSRISKDEVETLIKSAEAGKAVSAIAVVAAKRNHPSITAEALIEAFKHGKLLRLWMRADVDTQNALIEYMQANRTNKDEANGQRDQNL